jgi:hypothetical protein
MVIFRARRKIFRAMRREFDGMSPDCRPAREPKSRENSCKNADRGAFDEDRGENRSGIREVGS